MTHDSVAAAAASANIPYSTEPRLLVAWVVTPYRMCCYLSLQN